jgi:DNA-binding GntR family transcriptional regulator
MSAKPLDLRDALEDRILTGNFRPGDRLDEAAIARDYNVSRTPVRQALFQLAVIGLVEHIPRRGAFVREIGPKRLSEMFEVMAELEALCARNAARRADASDLAELGAHHEACGKAAADGDSDAYYYANERFHAAIRLIGGNSFLLDEINRIQKNLKAFRRLQLRARDRISSSLAEHARIVASLAAGDPDAAAREMRQHISIQGDRFGDLLATIARDKAAEQDLQISGQKKR